MSSSMRVWLPCGVAWALALGCGPDSEPAPPESTSGETDPTTTGVDTSATGQQEGSGESTTGAPWEAPLAKGGITVDWVQANQGVGVIIGQDGGEVGPTDRAAPLIKDRVTLIRAFWSLPADWQPREIEGRLTVTYADGTEESFSDTKLVEEESFEGDLGRSFFWGLMAEQSQPGLTYRVELYEATPDLDDEPDAAVAPTLPVDGGNAFVGIEDSYQVLKVVVVPFEYDDGNGCNTAPDTSEETMQLFQDLIYMQNPLDRLEYVLHEPIQWDTELANFGELHSFLSGLRFDEGALPETYYYGLVDVCAGGLNGAGGQANGIPTDPVDMGVAVQRISAGLSLDPDWSAETFVHEIGHSQGRRHVACDGEGGPDPSYPHEGGDVGEWGFGVIDFGLRHPTFFKDYMTYCHPTWVGTWGWNKVYPVIQGLSEWDAGFPGIGRGTPEGTTARMGEHDPYDGSLLVGTLAPGGEEYWITVPGSLPDNAPRGTTRLELSAGSTVVADVAAHVQEKQDGGGLLIMAPLPKGWSAVTDVVRVEGNVRTPVARGSIREHHQNRKIRR